MVGSAPRELFDFKSSPSDELEVAFAGSSGWNSVEFLVKSLPGRQNSGCQTRLLREGKVVCWGPYKETVMKMENWKQGPTTAEKE